MFHYPNSLKYLSLSFTLLLFLCKNSYPQEALGKYKAACTYIDSQLKTNSKVEKFNICPIVSFIGSTTFEKKLNDIDSNLIPNEIRNGRLYHSTFYFSAFFDKNIDSVFYKKDNFSFNKYLRLSKPFKNILLAELRNGYCILNDPATIPYFGRSTEFLFIFDNNDNIIKVLKNEMINN